MACIIMSGEINTMKPFGTWNSPISKETLTEDKVRLGFIEVKKDAIYWSEARPKEKGRVTIVKKTHKEATDLLDASFSTRTKVHEYGGKSFTCGRESIFFVNAEDQQIYKMDTNSENIQKLTDLDSFRFADIIVSKDDTYLFGVFEEHTHNEVINGIFSIDIEKLVFTKLVTTHDFFMGPRLSHDETKLSWFSWNHPNMPWDGSELWVANVNEGLLTNHTQVAGSIDVSVIDPEFGPDGALYFLSDKSGFWNLYKYENEEIEAIYPAAIEFGRPAWIFGESTYDFVNIEGREFILARGFDHGDCKLQLIDLATKKSVIIPTPFCYVTNIKVRDEKAYFIGSFHDKAEVLVEYNLLEKSFEVIKQSQSLDIDPRYISTPTLLEFPTEKGQMAYGYYYPPENPTYKVGTDNLPPVIIKCHGGPTVATTPSFNLLYQYFTSRGIAIFDINYSGSTGYGRRYRERLNGNWGVADVNDCINGAKYLIREKLADPKRIGIKGGSAGGYTALASICKSDLFSFAIAYYGVSDLIELIKDTHKFESNYTFKLIATLEGHENLYKERSPIHRLETIVCPVLFLQGGKDKVVPPSQSETMFKALSKKNIPCGYMFFEEEGHGFRQAETIQASIEAELYFYAKIFDLPIDLDKPKLTLSNI